MSINEYDDWEHDDQSNDQTDATQDIHADDIIAKMVADLDTMGKQVVDDSKVADNPGITD